jgi:hypothetical protein
MARFFLACLAALLATTIFGGPRAQREDLSHYGMIELANMASSAQVLDPTGKRDMSALLAAAVATSNQQSAPIDGHLRLPHCIHIPVGVFRIKVPPGPFHGAGCVVGEGSGQSIFQLDNSFSGDMFVWSESWYAAQNWGAQLRGVSILGAGRDTQHVQNAIMLYDRNDHVTLEDLHIEYLPGRAISSGKLRPYASAGQAYLRESHWRNICVFRSGTAELPAVEFTSEGGGHVDGSNEIRVSQLDIYGSPGLSLVIRNSSATGIVRDLSFTDLRIEGTEKATSGDDLLRIGDRAMRGPVGHLFFSGLELIDPPPGAAALRLTSADPARHEPARIMIQGFIGGGLANGAGLVVESGEFIIAQLNQIRTKGPQLVVGPLVRNLVLDGGGAEQDWTGEIAPQAAREVFTPSRNNLALRPSVKSLH